MSGGSCSPSLRPFATYGKAEGRPADPAGSIPRASGITGGSGSPSGTGTGRKRVEFMTAAEGGCRGVSAWGESSGGGVSWRAAISHPLTGTRLAASPPSPGLRPPCCNSCVCVSEQQGGSPSDAVWGCGQPSGGYITHTHRGGSVFREGWRGGFAYLPANIPSLPASTPLSPPSSILPSVVPILCFLRPLSAEGTDRVRTC